ncbi:MAG: imidazoleglycerol-phosphate dehydratase HisB [Planctomycetes bacterium]|nr:imidazoleglycerol-phosphate dehydratase HisB [Planctomycetota bacterium]
MRRRSAHVRRKTRETDVQVRLSLDGGGRASARTGIGFFDHMLEQVGKHALFDLEIRARGDLHIDQHHTVEDVGIALGDAIRQALGDKKGIRRYGAAAVPLDEALARAVVDFGGRPFVVFRVSLPKRKVGGFDCEMVEEFFRAFANHAGANVHLEVPYGNNSHHKIEACFKAFARACREAVSIDARRRGLPSTKGAL